MRRVSGRLCGLITQHRCHVIMCQVILHVGRCISSQFVSVSMLCRAAILPCGLGSGGQYWDETTHSCKNCAVGMFQQGWVSKLLDCVNKSASVKSNSSEFYCEKDVPKNCLSCDKSGRYQNVEGQSACHTCPEHAGRPIGSNFTSISNCKDT